MYEKKSPIEHVLLRPGMYVGSIDWMQQPHWVIDPNTKQMTKKEILYSPALLKIFDEILVNAADNVHRQSNLTEIRVKINTAQVIANPTIPLTISIQNDGKSIPLEIHEKEKVYIPELIFGHLLTGSNFDDSIERFTGGSHGYGAKLTNIFSQQFQITIYDAIQKKFYRQYWERNMSICHPAEIYDLKDIQRVANIDIPKLGDKSFIQVKFQPELELFGLPRLSTSSSDEERKRFETYLSDIDHLFRRRCYDIAGCLSTVKVYFNDSLLPIENFRDYATLFTPPVEQLKEHASHLLSKEIDETEISLSSEGKNPVSGFDFETPTYRVNDRLEFSILPMNLVKQSSGSHQSGNLPNESISFVNNVWTVRGGQHVQYLQSIVADSLLIYLKRNYKKELESFQKSTTPLLSMIKNQLFLIINCKIENPSFEGQTKDSLLTKANQFADSLAITSKELQQFWKFALPSATNSSSLPNYYHTQLLQSILEEISFQEHYRVFTSMDKTINTLANSKNKLLVQVPKLDDAHYAGKKESSRDCTLILTEGDSAKALAIAGLSAIGRDYYGVMPLRGKVLNVRAVTSKRQVINNQELMNLCKAMNLQFEKTYQTDEEFATLRYGHLLLMCDQDYDGSHIKGLIINFIHYFWPALLHRQGFLEEFITPIVKIRPLGTSAISSMTSTTTSTGQGKGKKKAQGFSSLPLPQSTGILSFYNLSEYETWKQQHLQQPKDYQSYFIKYYKGLGTNSNEEGKEYFQNIALHQKSFQSDGHESHLIDLVFNKDRAKDRKEWLLKTYSPDLFIDFTPPLPASSPSTSTSSLTTATHSLSKEGRTSEAEDLRNKYLSVLSYTDFINKELIHFSFSDNVRSIPHLLDGLKPSQRKVLYGSFLKFPSTTSTNKMKEMKVMQLAGFIAEKTSYHHGEQSLHHTIVNMAQQYVGANNVPLLLGIGQFGTRAKGGSDYASPRYIYTKLSPLARLLFPPEDDQLLEYLEDDGLSIEPDYFMPILPTILLNGSIGIGTGWSTDIPAYSIVQIIDYLLDKLERSESQTSARPPLVPYYHGFKGKIYPDVSTIDSSSSSAPARPKAYISEGKVRIIDRQTIEILELPVMKWTEAYKEFLLKLVEKGDLKSVQEYHSIHSIRFVVKLSNPLQYRHVYYGDPTTKTKKKKKSSKKDKKNATEVSEEEATSAEDDGWNHPENHRIWLQYFKLTNRINVNNMYAFNAQHQITHYATPEQMIDDFYPIRLQYYHYRQQFLAKSLYAQYFTLQQQQRFLQEILTAKEQTKVNTTSKSNRFNLLQVLSTADSKEMMIAALQSLGLRSLEEIQIQVKQTMQSKYATHPLHPKLFVSNSLNNNSNSINIESTETEKEEDREEFSEQTTTTSTTTSSKSQRGASTSQYDYLLQLPVYSFTKDRLNHLDKRIRDLEKRIAIVETTTAKDLWRQDLIHCRQKYLELEKSWDFD